MYIAFENLDFGWTREQLETVRCDWRRGYAVDEIAADVGRSSIEVLLLLLDQLTNGILRGRIEVVCDSARDGGVVLS